LPISTTGSPPLDTLLADVSRSFYLSLAVLPGGLRRPLSTAYLVARAADSIADTETIVRLKRRQLLDELRAVVEAVAAGPATPEPRVAARLRELHREVLGSLAGSAGAAQGAAAGGDVAEARLLIRLDACLGAFAELSGEDRRATARVLGTLIEGMGRDLSRFDGDRLQALTSASDLDEHCYYAAGCVGEYWSVLSAAHLPGVAHLASPELVDRGIRLGKALQMVNVLKDAPEDLAAGRCYLPDQLLRQEGLEPLDLVDERRRAGARPLVRGLVETALAHVDAAWEYVMAVPSGQLRLRLSCVWPLWIALRTLRRLALLRDPLGSSERRKIERAELYTLVAESTAVGALDGLLTRAHARRRAEVTAALQSAS
jgi:farnesyl-diphosphate farnesyltransferase